MTPRRRALAAVAALCLTVTAAAVALTASPAAAATYSAYVMGYFTESPSGTANDYGLHIAVSTDGRQWMPLNQNAPVVTPTAGTLGLRDPFILRKQDGTFVVLATDLKGTDWSLQNQYLHIWDSTDLTSFTNYRRVKMHSLATHTWAPTAFWDASRGQYGIVYSANNGTRNVFLVNYTTDFRTVSAAQTFFDPGFNVLDGDVVVDGATTYLYYKNSDNGNLYGARSGTGQPNTFTTYTGALLQSSGIEAPLLVKPNSGSTWTLWADSYSPVNGEEYVWTTSSISSNSWTPLGQRSFTQPLNAKHITIAGITSTEYTAMVNRWGAPSWRRIKSANFPDRYVRHANYVGRIDPYPFDPYADQQWKMVPGLADAAGVSFQSVNNPTRYLRHYAYAMRLDVNDGTAAFQADATFYKVAGLADGSWSSFRSYNYPTRYLRHYNYVLRIDPISTAAEQQDATFQVTY
jgi:hypothetical protein